MNLKVQLLANNSEKVARLQANATGKDLKLTAACVAESR